MAWAESSNQLLIFFKLDFSKAAYNMVDLNFLFGALHSLGFPPKL
jgi:hypothetical protein